MFINETNLQNSFQDLKISLLWLNRMKDFPQISFFMHFNIIMYKCPGVKQRKYTSLSNDET